MHWLCCGLGATGKARKWALNNWVGSTGPLSNFAELLTELDSPLRDVKWIKVPSHVGIQGNEEGDALGEIRWLSSPLLAISKATSARKMRHSISPQRSTLHLGNHRLVPLNFSDSESDHTDDEDSSPPPQHGPLVNTVSECTCAVHKWTFSFLGFSQVHSMTP